MYRLLERKRPFLTQGNAGLGEFERYVASFYTIDSAKQAYYALLEKLIVRKNKCHGKIYKNDPTIMAWQLGQ